MARKRPVIQEVGYGLYGWFDKDDKGLPKLLAFTTAVPPEVSQEFGYVLKIKHSRGMRIDFEIDHPTDPATGEELTWGMRSGYVYELRQIPWVSVTPPDSP